MHASIDDQKLVDLPILGDTRGSLCVIEGGRDIDFSIARVYYIFSTQPGVARCAKWRCACGAAAR